VHPEPLGGVLADGVFENGGEAGGVVEGVGFAVAGGGEGELGVEAQDILLFGVLPEKKAGKDGGAGLERDAGQARGGAGGDAEEGDEDALRRSHVGVHQDAYGVAIAHRRDEAAREVVLVQDAIAVLAADAVDEGVDEWIVEADDHAHGVAGEGVIEAGKLPCAKVASEDEDAFAAGARSEVVVEAFVADGGVGEGEGVGGHLAELGEQPTQISVLEAEDDLALRGGHLRECYGKIAHAGTAQAAE